MMIIMSDMNSSIVRRRCEVIMEEKTPLYFKILDIDTSKLNSEVSKSNLWKITSFSETTSLQLEPFLTMFYTINLSNKLVTNKGYANGYFE